MHRYRPSRSRCNVARFHISCCFMINRLGGSVHGREEITMCHVLVIIQRQHVTRTDFEHLRSVVRLSSISSIADVKVAFLKPETKGGSGARNLYPRGQFQDTHGWNLRLFKLQHDKPAVSIYRLNGSLECWHIILLITSKYIPEQTTGLQRDIPSEHIWTLALMPADRCCNKAWLSIVSN